MLVKEILNVKGRNVVTVSANDTLQTAATLLQTKRIGALLVVSNEEGLDGILSERDIVKAIGEHGSKALTMKVKDVMTTQVIIAREKETVLDVLSQMTRGRFRHMPVVENGEIRGMVSIGDIVKARLDEMAHEAENLLSYVRG
jgi:CBS domain-containing protein